MITGGKGAGDKTLKEKRKQKKKAADNRIKALGKANYFKVGDFNALIKI